MSRLTIAIEFLVVVSMATCIDVDKYLKLEWSEEVKNWEPSEELKNNFPAYLSGYSYEGSPVYILEYGRWNISNYVKSSNENEDVFYKRVKKLFRGLILEVADLDEPDTGAIIVLDGKGLSIKSLTSPPAKTYLPDSCCSFACSLNIDEKGIKNDSKIFATAVSYAAQTWVSAVRTVAGSVMGKAEIIRGGTTEMMAFLSSFMPKTNISSKYGGLAHQPLRVY